MSSNTTASLYNSNFNKWTPVIGVYIAVATFVCATAIAVDLVRGTWRRQYWIPSNFSSLNAVSIAIIAAASKLSLDVSTSMPRKIDQLSKLGTSAFVCIALASITPSIGKLESSELLSNITALSVFVISSVVGICIQLRTGVIFTFQTAHITMIVMICILLVRCVLLTTSLPIFKSCLDVKYNTEHQKALSTLHDGEYRKHPTTKKLKEYLERFSMMAHSGSLDFLIARLAASIFHTLCGFVAAMTFFTILVACVTHTDTFLGPTSRSGTSNYDWSVLYILIIQTIAVTMGTTVLCIRGFYSAMVQSGQGDATSTEEQSGQGEPTSTQKQSTEKYWMEGSELIKWMQLFPCIEYREQKWLGYLVIYPIYATCLSFQMLLAVVDLFLFRVIPILLWSSIFSKMRAHPPPCPHRDDPVPKELRPYFLQLSNEMTKPEVMMTSISYVSKKCLEAAERETDDLRELLQVYYTCGFEGVVKFRIPSIPPNSLEPPPHSWALSVLTLTWIAIALPNVDRQSMAGLRKSVMESLVYVKLIEDNYNNKHDFFHVRFAANILWSGLVAMPKISFYLRCVHLDIKKLLFRDRTAKETLECIKECAIQSFNALSTERSVKFFPYIAMVAHYVYGTCEMILQDCENGPDDSVLIFDKLRATISGILGACLINLKAYILLECERSSSVEKRREAACKILKLFGETEKIMETLEARQIPDITPKEMVHMDNWSQSQRHRHAPTSQSP